MSTAKKMLLVGIAVVVVVMAGFFIYIDKAFPIVRNEAFTHLAAPDELADCYDCHAKVTASLGQDWRESKHGVLLVKCFVCHGQPDGLGAIPFNVKPSYNSICSRCHEPSMRRMEAKFGEVPDCETCHPRHQNPMHRNAFESVVPSAQTSF